MWKEEGGRWKEGREGWRDRTRMRMMGDCDQRSMEAEEEEGRKSRREGKRDGGDEEKEEEMEEEEKRTFEEKANEDVERWRGIT